MDDIPATNVDQHHTPPSDGDECHSNLQNDGKETRSSEGSDTGMVNTHVLKVSGTTATEHNSDKFANYEPVNQASGIRESLILAEHLDQRNATQKGEQRPQQNTNKKELNTNELSASHDQETSQEDQEDTKYEHTDKEQSQDNEQIAPGLEKLPASQVTNQNIQEDTKYEHTDKEQSQNNEEIAPGLEKLPASQVTNQNIQEDNKDEHTDKERNTKIITKKGYFQQYLTEKGLNHQPNGKLVKTTDLEFCLSMYTDLDVLDEDNKFICKPCTAQKQCT